MFCYYHVIGFRVLHHPFDDVQGRGLGFLGSTASLTHPVTAFEVPEGSVTLTNYFRKVNPLGLWANLQVDHPP